MEMVFCFLLSFCIWMLAATSALFVVVSFLFLCFCFLGVFLSVSIWKGFLVVLAYVGGLLVMVIYLASLVRWTISGAVFMFPVFLGVSILSETGSSVSAPSMGSFFVGSFAEFWFCVLFIGLVCFFVSQLLLSGSHLRSLEES